MFLQMLIIIDYEVVKVLIFRSQGTLRVMLQMSDDKKSCRKIWLFRMDVLTLHPQTPLSASSERWYLGRVVRHRSAKPSTAVRFC